MVSWKFCASVASLLTLVVALADCGPASDVPAALVPIVQPMASWEGTGSQTLGLVSQSGSFRIHWTARPEAGRNPATGTFKLTVHSGVSGRPLQEVVDQRGPGEGVYNFADDPRPFNLMVDSDGLVWSISVDETILVKPQGEGVH